MKCLDLDTTTKRALEDMQGGPSHQPIHDDDIIMQAAQVEDDNDWVNISDGMTAVELASAVDLAVVDPK